MGHKKWHETQLAACKAVGSPGDRQEGLTPKHEPSSHHLVP